MAVFSMAHSVQEVMNGAERPPTDERRMPSEGPAEAALGYAPLPMTQEMPLRAPAERPVSYEVRVIVHEVEDIQRTGLELFPDVYVKAKITHGGRGSARTDTHKNCVDRKALFQYRMVLPPVSYKTVRTRWQRLFRRHPPPPTLKIVVKEEDNITRDDVIGTLTLDLTKVPHPEPQGYCSKNTLNNPKENLFTKGLSKPHGVGQVSGYWPVMKRKTFNRGMRMTGKVFLTIQVVPFENVEAFPGDAGNIPGPHNINPKLTKPFRESGDYKRRLVLEPLQNFESILLYVLNSTWFRIIVVALVLGFLGYKNTDQIISFLRTASVTLYHRAIKEYPIKTAIILVYYYLFAFFMCVYSGTIVP